MIFEGTILLGAGFIFIIGVIMATFSDVKNKVAEAQAQVAAAVKSLSDQIAAFKVQLASGEVVPAADLDAVVAQAQAIEDSLPKA